MSQTIELILKIKKVGEETVKKVFSEIKKGVGEINRIEVFPSKKLGEQIKKIVSSLQSVNKNVKRIARELEKEAKKASKNVQSNFTTTTNAIGATLTRAGGMIFSKFALITATAAIIPAATLKAYKSSILYFEGAFTSIEKKMARVSMQGGALSKSISFSGALENLKLIYTELGAVSGRILTLGLSGLFFHFTLSQISILVRRIRTGAIDILTPAERAQRLLETIDKSVHVMQRRFSSLFDVVGLGLFAIFGPVSGFLTAVPLINSFLENFSGVFTRITLRARAFFGSSQAQFQLIFLDLKEILSILLPKLLSFLKSGAGKDFLKNFGTSIKSIKEIAPPKISIFRAFFDDLNVLFSRGEKKPKKLDFTSTPLFPHWKEDWAQAREKLGREWEGFKTFISTLSSKVKGGGKALSTIFREGYSPRLEGNWLKNIFSEKKRDIEKQVTGLLDFSSILKRSATGEKRFEGDAARRITDYLSLLQNALKKFKPEKVTGGTETLLKSVFGDVSKTSAVGKEFIQSVVSFMNEATRRVNEKGKEFSLSFSKALTESLKRGAPTELQKKMSDALKALQGLILLSLPQTKESGKKIFEELARGLQESEKGVTSATEKAVQKIDDYLPHSPAKVGPLKALVLSGYLIGQQLATGIVSSQTIVNTAAFSISLSIISVFSSITKRIGSFGLEIYTSIQSIFSRLKPYIDEIKSTLFEAFKIGGGPTEVALIEQFKQYGVHAGESVTSIERLKKTLFGMSEEAVDSRFKLSSLGVSFNEIRSSANPVVSLYSKLADVIKNSEVGTREHQIAIEALSTSLSSNLILSLREGGEVFENDFNRSLKNSVFLSDDLRKGLLEFQRAWNSIWMYVRGVVAVALKELLPSINEQVSNFYNFLSANTAKIAGLIVFLIGLARKSLNVFLGIFKSLLKEPAQTVDSLIALLLISIEFVSNILSAFIEGVLGSFKNSGQAILNVLDKMMIGLIGAVGEILPEIINIVLDLAGSVTSRLADWLDKGAPGAVAKLTLILVAILKFLGTWIYSAAFKIGIFIASSLGDIYEFLKGRIALIVQQFIALFAEEIKNAIEKNKTLKRMAEFLFGKNSLNSLNQFTAASVAVMDDFERNVEKRKKNIGEGLKFAIAFEVEGAETGITGEGSAEKLAASMNRAKEKLKIALSSIRDDLKEIKTEAGEALSKALSPEQIEKYKSLFSSYLADLKMTVSEMPADMKVAFEEFGAYLSEGKLSEAIEKFEELLSKVGETAGETGEKVKGVAESFVDFVKDFAPVGEALSGILSNMSTAFTDLYEMSGKKLKEFYIAQKAVAVGEIIVNTAKGVMAALVAPPTPMSPWNIAQAAAIAAMGTVQLAKVVQQSIQGFIGGGFTGMVPGATKGKDNKLIAVDGKEFVQPAETVRYYGVEFMERLRQRLVPKEFKAVPTMFQMGGVVGSTNLKSKENTSTVIVQNTNIVDPGLMARFFATQAGRRSLTNFISDNSTQIKSILAR